MNQYWENLRERERWFLIVGGGIGVVYLLYLLVFAPLLNGVNHAKQELREKKDTLLWMKAVKRDFKVQTKKRASASQLLTLLANQMRAEPFKYFSYQLQQTGATDIQLTFEAVAYLPFIEWLWKLNQDYSISIKQFLVERTPTPGVVKLTLVLAAV